MSEVKRYGHAIKGHEDGGFHVLLMEHDEGTHVLYADYAAVKAERDELARWVLGHGYIGNAIMGGWCANCQRSIGDGHKKGCPVALAEKITKEVGDA